MRTASSGRFFAMLLLAGLLAVGYFAGQRGLADVVAQDPRYEMERWRSGKFVADNIKLDAIQAALNEARNLDPRNPYLMGDVARFHAARVERRQASDPAVREARQQSLAWFRQALEQHPTSGHTWLNVALMKFHLGEIDQEFSRSLQQAMRRSPWDSKVQLLAIELGLANWRGLDDPPRETLKQAIQAQARWQLVRQKPALQLLLKRYRRADLDYLLE